MDVHSKSVFGIVCRKHGVLCQGDGARVAGVAVVPVREAVAIVGGATYVYRRGVLILSASRAMTCPGATVGHESYSVHVWQKAGVVGLCSSNHDSQGVIE